MGNNYEKAYTEILEILKYIPKEEYERIPKEKILFFEENCDKDYEFKFDINKSLDEQEFLRETNAIIVVLFRDYFATDIQKEKLQKILLENERKYQEELREKYNPDDIFKKKQVDVKKEEIKEENVQMVEYKEPILRRIVNKILEILGFIK